MCDQTSPVESKSRKDDVLEMYRSSHEQVARYTVYLTPEIHAKNEIIETGLPLQAARDLMEALNAKRERISFGGPIYGIQLENDAEALASVRVASEQFWAARRAA